MTKHKSKRFKKAEREAAQRRKHERRDEQREARWRAPQRQHSTERREAPSPATHATPWWAQLGALCAPGYGVFSVAGSNFDGVRSVSEALSPERAWYYSIAIVVAWLLGRWMIRRVASFSASRLTTTILTSACVGGLLLTLSPFWFPIVAPPRTGVPVVTNARERAEQRELEIRVHKLVEEAHDILGGEEGAALIRDTWEITPQELVRAHRKLDEALKLDPFNIPALQEKGLALSQGGRALEAVQVYKRVLRGRHGSTAHHQLALAHARLGRFNDAVSEFRRILKHSESKCCDAGLYANFAFALLRSGDTKGAEEQARNAIAKDPTVFWAYDTLGDALHRQGRVEEALQVFLRNIELHPDRVMSYSNAASMLDDLGRPREAVALARKGITVDPRYPRTHEVLAVALAGLGDKKGCLQAAKEAVRVSPKEARYHSFLGRAYAENGDFRSAAASFQQAFALDPDETAYESYAQHAQEHADGLHKNNKDPWIFPEGPSAHAQQTQRAQHAHRDSTPPTSAR